MSPIPSESVNAIEATDTDANSQGHQLDAEHQITENEDIAQVSLDLSSCSGCTCPISLLPFEILHLILEAAIPPSIFLDPAICRGPYSAWCQMLRQLKAFVLVCHMWRDVGTDLLYRCVVIRRFGQLPALLRSLQRDPKLGPMVCELQINCFVPRGCRAVFEQGLAQLWPLCPNATRLALDHQTDDTRGFPSVLDSMLPSIVELQFGPDYSIQRAFPLLLQCTGLVALSITFGDYIGEADDIPFVVLESLEELHISHTLWCHEPRKTDVCAIISKHCSLPRLRRLTAKLPPHSLMANGRTLYRLLCAHGEELTHLSTCFSVVPLQEEVQKYLNLCPSLQHFSTNEHTGITRLSHPKLEYLDVWVLYFDSLIRVCVFDWRAHLPALRMVRFLDSALLSTAGARLPLVLPPDTSVSLHLWIYPGVRVQDDGEEIYQADHAAYDFDTESEDGSWVPAQTPSDLSDEFNSTDEDSSSLSGQLQEALEIFEDTLAREETRLEEDYSDIGGHTVSSWHGDEFEG